MTIELTRANLLRRRYETYSANEPLARRTDADEFWVFDAELCREVLTSECFTARRRRLADLASSAGHADLGRFFSAWLMYSDGPDHIQRRRAVVRALSRTARGRSAPSASVRVSEERRRIELVSEYSSPFVWAAILAAFGVPEELHADWRAASDAVTTLPGMAKPSTEDLAHAARALEVLRELASSSAASAFTTALTSELPHEYPELILDLAINVVSDGVHPTVAALSTEIWLRLVHDSAHAVEAGTSRHGLRFTTEAPFQYAARQAEEDCVLSGVRIARGDRVVACLGAAARGGRDDGRLVFGHGRHACVGRDLAVAVVESGVRVFFSAWPAARPITAPQWFESLGYRSIEHLELEVLSSTSSPSGFSRWPPEGATDD